jgi:serine/threonine protein phosphatase PrpC
VSLQIKALGRSDVGLVRAGNEDCLHLDDAHFVYAVCDGMGGHQAGEVASITASDVIRKSFGRLAQELMNDPGLSIGRTLPPAGELLVKSVRLANRAIYTRAAEEPSLSGMGTTVVAAALEADIMSIVHVGDSRAYHLTDRQLVPLTRDHSWVAEIQASHNLSEEEATSFVGKNVITRALGVREAVDIDCRIIKVKPGDQFILCSDGLCGFADDDEIFDVAREYRGDLPKIVDALIQLANDRGGSDNVTVAAFEITSARESPLPELDTFTIEQEKPEVLAAEDRWLSRLAEADHEEPAVAPSKKKKTNKLILSVIFALFVIVAALILWFLPSGK